jgi:hypothetical protein
MAPSVHSLETSDPPGCKPLYFIDIIVGSLDDDMVETKINL